MSSSANTTAPRPVAQWLVRAVTYVLAVGLVALFLPTSLVVAGLFTVAVAVLRRTLPRPVRTVLFVIGLTVAATSALLLADFGWGTSQLG